MAPFYGWVQLPQGLSYFEEAVYSLPHNQLPLIKNNIERLRNNDIY